MLRSCQQLSQILLPERGPGVGAMPVSLLGNRNQYKPALLYVFDFALRNAQFRWVDEIIRRIDEHHRRLDGP